MRRTQESTDVREEGLEALEALGNEHRIAILQALAAADDPLPFSELRRRVGVDDTGRFNYHLTELQDRFVRQSDGGYELGYAGERLVLAGAGLDPETATAMESTEGAECPVCGDPDCEKLIHVHLSGR